MAVLSARTRSLGPCVKFLLIHFLLVLAGFNSLRAVSLNIGLRATTSLCGKPNNRLVK